MSVVIGHVVYRLIRRVDWTLWLAVRKSMCLVRDAVAYRGLPNTVQFSAFGAAFNSFRVSSAGPNSCLLSNMWVAYTDVGLLLGVYLMCSLCLIVIGLQDCPTLALFQVLHFSWYMPLGLGFMFLCASCWYTYCIDRSEGYFNVSSSEYVKYFVYSWTVICKSDPFFTIVLLPWCGYDIVLFHYYIVPQFMY